MKKSFTVGADSRNDQGKGASRRLRRAGKVPAILYGGKGEPANVMLDQRNLLTMIDNEKFYSSVITLHLDGQDQQAIIKDIQMHPAKSQVLHVDLQRVLADQAIRIHIPLHFMNAAASPGVKVQGGLVSHLRTDIEISCLPKDLPEAIEVDMVAMNLHDTIFLRDLKLPAGVTVPELSHGRNVPIVAIHAPRAEEPEAVVAEVAAAAPAAGDAKPGEAAKPGDAKAAAPAADAKKEGGKK